MMLVIMGRILQDVEEVFTWLVKQTNKMGLEINKKIKDYLWLYHESYTMKMNV